MIHSNILNIWHFNMNFIKRVTVYLYIINNQSQISTKRFEEVRDWWTCKSWITSVMKISIHRITMIYVIWNKRDIKKLRLFSYVRNLKIDVVLKASRAVVIGWFYLNEAPLGLFKFISDYLHYFEKKYIWTCKSWITSVMKISIHRITMIYVIWNKRDMVCIQ
jgi:hypothetical protein